MGVRPYACVCECVCVCESFFGCDKRCEVAMKCVKLCEVAMKGVKLCVHRHSVHRHSVLFRCIGIRHSVDSRARWIVDRR